MPYTRPNIVSGVTRATKAFFDNLLDGIDERVTKVAADATYVRSVNGVPVGPDGNVEVEGGGGASSSHWYLDTDGVPYFDQTGTGPSLQVLFDTDGVPYFGDPVAQTSVDTDGVPTF
ncbi:hypothetical protein SEA_BOBBOB_22 [Gordonia phage BobBob]|nr:hypothetical protein SEA_BOBBOB_22 [Gordonia phage BobBob]